MDENFQSFELSACEGWRKVCARNSVAKAACVPGSFCQYRKGWTYPHGLSVTAPGGGHPAVGRYITIEGKSTTPTTTSVGYHYVAPR